MQLARPEIPSCADCQAWIYDSKTWKRQQRGGADVPRPAGTKTPCWECPKKSPELEWQFVLSPQNRQTMELFYQVRAAGWGSLPEGAAKDPILVKNFTLIDRIVREHESEKLAQTMLLPLISSQSP